MMLRYGQAFSWKQNTNGYYYIAFEQPIALLQEHSRAKYDLEFLDGNEQECIEMVNLSVGLHNQ